MPRYDGQNERPGARDAIAKLANTMVANGMDPAKAKERARKAATDFDRSNPTSPHGGG